MTQREMRALKQAVTPATIARAKQERDAERAANGIVCDADGRLIVVPTRTMEQSA